MGGGRSPLPSLPSRVLVDGMPMLS
uniref:Uncharacterized protein n=1 Tax=Anguilla anguilla TaxID=7936 RepID=A0A0E9XNG3_ANGAN